MPVVLFLQIHDADHVQYSKSDIVFRLIKLS